MLLFKYIINVSDADCQIVVVCVSGSAHTIFLLKNRANPEEFALRLMYVYNQSLPVCSSLFC